MSERRGLWSILEHPFVYETFHTLIGARRWMHRFATETIRAGSGDRVLDIGCGPGALLQFFPGTAYIGLDRSEGNIARANATYEDRGHFIGDDVGISPSTSLRRSASRSRSACSTTSMTLWRWPVAGHASRAESWRPADHRRSLLPSGAEVHLAVHRQS